MAATQMKIKLVANDGTKFEIYEEIAFQSKLIKEMCANLDCMEDFEVDVPHADGKTLKKVLDFCLVFRNEEPKKIPGEKRIKLTSGQERFLKVSDEFLLQIIQAADFLDIPCLIAICTQKLANLVAGKKPEEIRKIYMLPDDLTAEKKMEVQKKWQDHKKKYCETYYSDLVSRFQRHDAQYQNSL